MWIHKTKYCRYQNWIPIENLWFTRVCQSYINQCESSRNARHSCCVALPHYWSQFSTLSKQVISKWDLSVTPSKHISGFFELYFSNVELLCKCKTKCLSTEKSQHKEVNKIFSYILHTIKRYEIHNFIDFTQVCTDAALFYAQKGVCHGFLGFLCLLWTWRIYWVSR